jgi:hypothetical protein
MVARGWGCALRSLGLRSFENRLRPRGDRACGEGKPRRLRSLDFHPPSGPARTQRFAWQTTGTAVPRWSQARPSCGPRQPPTAVVALCPPRKRGPRAVAGPEFTTLRGVWGSGGVVARSVVYWAGFCQLCRRAALGVAMPRTSLNVLRPSTGILCSCPYALPRDGITAGPSVRPVLSTPTQVGCTAAWQADYARFHGGGRA